MKHNSKKMFSCHYTEYGIYITLSDGNMASVGKENCLQISRIIRICNGHSPLTKGINENMMWVSTAVSATD